MPTSSLYRIHPESKTLQSVREVNFSDHDFLERYDIQEWVEESPSILGERLLIVAKEKTYFDGTNERPDLVAIDEKGNIVVIELKRDDSGADVHWQAIKYASYWSRFSVQDVLEVYADYLMRHRQEGRSKEVDAEDAKQEIIDFINQETVENINKRQRIILVSHRFSKEAISAVDWLIENYGLDVRCIQLIPYFDADKSTYYLQSNMILPVAGIDEYLVKPSPGRAVAARGSRGSRNDDQITRFFESFWDDLLAADSLANASRPSRHSRWAGSDYRFRYYHFWYRDGLWDNWQLSYKVRLYNNLETNGKYRDKACIFLEINTKYLLEHGITERKLEDLSHKLKALCEKESDLSFLQKAEYFSIETSLPAKTLDDALKEAIKKALIKLIASTFPDVQKTIDIENKEVEQVDGEGLGSAGAPPSPSL
jgi:hypothetical protein